MEMDIIVSPATIVLKGNGVISATGFALRFELGCLNTWNIVGGHRRNCMVQQKLVSWYNWSALPFDKRFLVFIALSFRMVKKGLAVHLIENSVSYNTIDDESSD
jgi:hypothetical protein